MTCQVTCRIVNEARVAELVGAAVEGPLRAEADRVGFLNAGHVAVTIILLPGAPYHHSETSGRRAKVFELSVWARIGSAFASRASAPSANSSGVRQLAARAALRRTLADEAASKLAGESGSKLPHSRTRLPTAIRSAFEGNEVRAAVQVHNPQGRLRW